MTDITDNPIEESVAKLIAEEDLGKLALGLIDVFHKHISSGTTPLRTEICRYLRNHYVRPDVNRNLDIDIPATLEALRTQYQFCSDAIVPRKSQDAPTLEQLCLIREAHHKIIFILEAVNSKADVNQELVEALDNLTQDLLNRAEWDGECKVVCCGNGVFFNAIEALAKHKAGELKKNGD